MELFSLMIARAITLLFVTSPCFAFHSSNLRHANLGIPWSSSSTNSFSYAIHDLHNRLCAQRDDNDDVAAQDVRAFLTQRSIQSFMFLLAATRDLHTVWWLDNFIQPITINNYWDDDADSKPGSADTFRENDMRQVFLCVYSHLLYF